MNRLTVSEARIQLCSLVQNPRKRTIISSRGKDLAAIVPAREALALETLEAQGLLQAVLDALP